VERNKTRKLIFDHMDSFMSYNDKRISYSKLFNGLRIYEILLYVM